MSALGESQILIPPPERGRVDALDWCVIFIPLRVRGGVGVDRPVSQLTPTRLPPIKSGVATLPLSGGGIERSSRQ